MTDEWYTPKWIFDELNIEFDLDVCSPDGGIPWIPAINYYTKTDDGLSQPWVGTVWCNPPFSNAKPWIEKFVEHGHGVALCPVSKTRWFDKVVLNPDVEIQILPSTLKFVRNGEMKSVRTCCCLLKMGI
jgi:hypothetical protein|tara:strand:+ start:68 stop:454 length:387 start_codon:yes stop_codon:yes gene_type:complete